MRTVLAVRRLLPRTIDFYGGLEMGGWRLLSFIGCVTGVLAGVLIIAQPPSPGDLGKIYQYCGRTFGSGYTSRKPQATVLFHKADAAKHSPTLIRTMREVDRQLAQNPLDYERVVVRLENRLAEDPGDSIRLFRLGYAFIEAQKIAAGQGGSLWFEGDHTYWGQVLDWMVSVPPTGAIAANHDRASFEWLRMRFVIQVSDRGQKELIPLGRWLLAQNPEDFSLQHSLADVLGSQRNDADTLAAIALCDAGLRRSFARSSWYSLKSYSYQTRWLALGHKRTDLEQAIQAIEDALKSLPAGARSEAALRHLLGALQSMRTQSH